MSNIEFIEIKRMDITGFSFYDCYTSSYLKISGLQFFKSMEELEFMYSKDCNVSLETLISLLPIEYRIKGTENRITIFNEMVDILKELQEIKSASFVLDDLKDRSKVLINKVNKL